MDNEKIKEEKKVNNEIANMNNYEEDQKTILVVDDEKPIVDILTYNLQKEGYATLEADDGEKAIQIATEQKPDLILLDVMLPKIDGLTVCKKLKHTLNIPILMLSARGDEIDKIIGLELGADDYITKPFSIRELMARVKANLRKVETKPLEAENLDRKSEKEEEDIIKVGDLVVDCKKFEVRIKNKVLCVTPGEFKFIKYLAKQPDQVVTREDLIRDVWGYEYYGNIRNIDVTVRRIREKIEALGSPQMLITKRGAGYYLSSTNDK